jgi:transcriptional regulator with XRE-family HTH domain
LLAYKELYPELTFDALIIKVNREFLKGSLKDISNMIGVTKQSVGQWETGVRGISDKTRLKIAEALNFDVNEFKPEYWD